LSLNYQNQTRTFQNARLQSNHIIMLKLVTSWENQRRKKKGHFPIGLHLFYFYLGLGAEILLAVQAGPMPYGPRTFQHRLQPQLNAQTHSSLPPMEEKIIGGGQIRP
jgi:hypothetical protein